MGAACPFSDDGPLPALKFMLSAYHFASKNLSPVDQQVSCRTLLALAPQIALFDVVVVRDGHAWAFAENLPER
jgi:hypothetical protein